MCSNKKTENHFQNQIKIYCYPSDIYILILIFQKKYPNMNCKMLVISIIPFMDFTFRVKYNFIKKSPYNGINLKPKDIHSKLITRNYQLINNKIIPKKFQVWFREIFNKDISLKTFNYYLTLLFHDLKHNNISINQLVENYFRYHFCIFKNTIYCCDFFENGCCELLWTSQLSGHHCGDNYCKELKPKKYFEKYWEKWFDPYNYKIDGCWSNFHGKPNIF